MKTKIKSRQRSLVVMMDRWPASWAGVEEDLEFGRELVGLDPDLRKKKAREVLLDIIAMGVNKPAVPTALWSEAGTST